MTKELPKRHFQVLGIAVRLKTLKKWYEDKKMSSNQISEKILKEYGLTVSPRAITRYITKKIGTRNHRDAMRVRVIQNRMDYEKAKAKTDYINRKIDYQEVWFKRSPNYTGPLKHPKRKQVYLPQPYIDRIRNFAKRSNKTITDVLKEILGPAAAPYSTFTLCKIENSFRPYSYSKRLLMERLDRYFAS